MELEADILIQLEQQARDALKRGAAAGRAEAEQQSRNPKHRRVLTIVYCCIGKRRRGPSSAEA